MGFKISGRVRINGSPQEGVEVFAVNEDNPLEIYRVETGPAGIYEFTTEPDDPEQPATLGDPEDPWLIAARHEDTEQYRGGTCYPAVGPVEEEEIEDPDRLIVEDFELYDLDDTEPTDPVDDPEDYDVNEVDAGEAIVVYLTDNSTVENILFDVTASDADVWFVQSDDVGSFNGATNTTLRNIGVKGFPAQRGTSVTAHWYVPDGNGGIEPHGTTQSRGVATYIINVCETDPGGESLYENILIDGRQAVPSADAPDTSSSGDVTTDYGSRRGGMTMNRANPGHRGVAICRHNFLAGFGDNAAYTEGNTGDENTLGGMLFEYCYHRDNSTTNFRNNTGSDFWGTMRNCVVVMNDPDGTRGEYPLLDAAYSYRGNWHRGDHDATGFDEAITWDHCYFYNDPDDIISIDDNSAWLGISDDAGNYGNAYYVIEDCHVNSEYVNDQGYADADDAIIGLANNVQISGSVLDNFDMEAVFGVDGVNGVPRSPEEAAGGVRGIPVDWNGPAPGGGRVDI